MADATNTVTATDTATETATNTVTTTDQQTISSTAYFEPTYIPTGPLPVLAATWTPESTCFDTTMWRPVSYIDGDGNATSSNMFAVPTIAEMMMKSGTSSDGGIANPSGTCVPPDYTISAPYITDGPCPRHYTEACRVTDLQYAGNSADLVSCCPSVNAAAVVSGGSGAWEFGCYNGTRASGVTTTDGAALYGCTTVGAADVVWTGVEYDYDDATSGTESTPATTTLGSGTGSGGTRIMNAYAVVMVSTAPVPATDTTAPPLASASNSDSGNGTTGSTSGGLSTAAAAGIGVGVAMGVLAVLGSVIGLLFWRRRQRKMAQEQREREEEKEKEKNGPEQLHLVVAELPGSALPPELPGLHGEGELDNPRVRPELHGKAVPAELQGDDDDDRGRSRGVGVGSIRSARSVASGGSVGGYYRAGENLYWVTPVSFPEVANSVVGEEEEEQPGSQTKPPGPRE